MPLYPPGLIEPCLPTISRTVQTGSQWAYEIKHDGFRFLCIRQHKRVRVYSRGGHDWGAQLAAIVEAMRALPVKSAVLDGEGVICGPTASPISIACALYSAADLEAPTRPADDVIGSMRVALWTTRRPPIPPLVLLMSGTSAGLVRNL